MKIDDFTIPAVMIDAFGKMAERASGNTLLLMASDQPTLFYGHRVIEKNVPIARDHLKKTLRRMSVLNEPTRALLQTGSPLQSVLATLSPEVLIDEFADFAAYFGETDFLASALLEPNELIRAAALAFMAQWDQQDSEPNQREAAKAKLRADYADFLKALNELASDVPVIASEVLSSQKPSDLAKQTKALEAANLEIQRLNKQILREAKAAQETAAQHQQQLRQARRELAAATQNQLDVQAELAKAQAALIDLQNTYELRLYTELGRAMGSQLQQWLLPAQALEQTLSRAQQNDTVAKAKALLAAQREQDRHFGNRAQLSAQIAERQQLLLEIQSARTDALNPLPSLAAMAEQLAAEIQSLQQTLQPSPPVLGEVATALQLQINAATVLDRLLEVRHFIQQADHLGLLKGEALSQIYQLSDNKACQLYAAVAHSGKGVQPDTCDYFHLRRALQQQTPFMLFVDGHNVLYSLARIFAPYFEQGHPKTQAHRALADALVCRFAGSAAKVKLYFDSATPDEHDLSEQVRIVYSGGVGANRADNAVIKHLQFLAQTDHTQPICLVTKDHDFARQAEALGAIIMHPEEFAISLDLSKLLAY